MKLRISCSWPSYSGAVIHNGFVCEFFFWFWKFSIFCSKSIGVCLRFFRKSQVWGKNWTKLCISCSWPPYSRSIVHNGLVYEFLQLLKISNFCSKFIGVSKRFVPKITYLQQKEDQNTVFLGCDPHILDQLYKTVSYLCFLWVFKKFNLSFKIHRC
jgi:hypothetical protein